MTLDLESMTDDQLRKLIKLIDIKETRLDFVKNYHLNDAGEKLEFTRFRHMLDW